MKNLITVITFLLIISSVHSQDTLIKRNAEEMKVKILEVQPKTISFKLHNNPEGPTITMHRNEVHKIIYQNGTEQMFSPMKKVELGKYDTRREPGKAAFFSILFPGAGQLYNKQNGKAAIMGGLYTAEFIYFLSQVSARKNDLEYGEAGFQEVGLMLMGATLIWSVIDAPIQSGIINRRYNLASLNKYENDRFVVRVDPVLFNQMIKSKDFSPVYGANISLRFK